MSMTYDSLVDRVMKYLIRTDPETRNQVIHFVDQAQQRICGECVNIGFEQYVTGNFNIGQYTYAKPARWASSISFTCGLSATSEVRTPIELRSYDYLTMYWPDRTLTDTPLYYADYSFDNLIVAPTPDQNYPFEFSYLEIVPTLGPTQQTNWLTNHAPDLLLNATLLEALPFLQNYDQVPVWEQRYQAAVARIKTQDANRRLDRQSNRGAD